LLAVAALAIIVAAVAFIVSQFRGGDGNENSNQPSTVVAVSGSPTSEADSNEGEAAPSEPEATQPEANEGDEGTNAPDAEPTRTPRVNRPTEEPGDLTGGEEETGGDEEPSARTSARQWLPTSGDIGEGFNQTNNGRRSEEEVVASFGEGSDAAEQLTAFGWQENVFREFDWPDGGATDTTNVTVSVHRFETESGARDAMPYFAAGSGMETVEDAPELGEESISVQAVLEGGNAYVIYVRQDEFVLRISGFSVTGDPSATTVAVTEAILAG
jgi:hypothetical protein